MRDFTFESKNDQETYRLGAVLGRLAAPGLVVALKGPLGAGKTTFTRGVAEGVGADTRQVTSPTFVLIQEYPGRIPIYHFDAYRLSGDQDFVELGVDEYFNGDGICLVEWADRVERILPGERLDVTLGLAGPQERRIEIRSLVGKYDSLVEDWRAAMSGN